MERPDGATIPTTVGRRPRFFRAPSYLGVPATLVERALSGTLAASKTETVAVADFFVPYARGANVPDQDQALWFYSQMVRWGASRGKPRARGYRGRELSSPDFP